MGREMRMGAVRVLVAAIGWCGWLATHTSAGPAGSKIAFEGDRFGPWGLAVMNPDGTGAASLDIPGAADASWSPNGQLIAFEADPLGDGNLEIFIMNADGTNVRQLTHTPWREVWPDWFPDGRHLAFTSDQTGVPQVWVMNVDGSDQRALVDDPEFGTLQPDVSNDGKEVVFLRSRQFEPPTIWKVSVADGTLTALTQPGPYEDVDPQFSPNGQRVVFSSSRSGTFEIWVMDANGGNLTQLTATPGADFNPTFSPNGQQIAWWKQRFGQGDIWTMNADGSEQINVTDTPVVFEAFPDWHQGHLGK